MCLRREQPSAIHRHISATPPPRGIWLDIEQPGRSTCQQAKVWTRRRTLCNEFLKEHRKVEAQEGIITQLKSTVAEQQEGMKAVIAHLKEQDSKIQKVSAQIELNKPAPRTVLNNP